MGETKYPSLSEIRAAHASRREYERYLFVNRYIFRPPSFPAIWLLVRLGVSSETVSWLSGLAALAGFVCLLWPGTLLLWPGIAFLILFNFFDCLDGGIARIMRTRNPYGRFLDSIMWWADMLFWTVIGVTVWRVPGLRLAGDALGVNSGVWLAVGALSAFLAAYAAYLENTFDQVLREHWETLLRREGVTQASTPIAGKSGPEVFARVLVHNLRVRETHYVLLAVSFALGCADLLLAFFLAVNAALVPSLLFTYCRRGRKIYESGLGRDTAR
jgi:phosphatidylglycerophosphate synthase